MKNKCDILIFVEHVARELDLACLIKAIVEEKYGLNVKISSLSYFDRNVYISYKPKLVVVPYCYSYYGVVKNISKNWPRARIFNLRYEQIFQNINVNLKNIKGSYVGEYITHHAWAEMYKLDLIKQGVSEKNIVVGGNLSYYLYLPKYNPFFESRAELSRMFNIDMRKKWIFLPENYGAAFYSDDRIASKIKEGISATDVYKYKEFAYTSLEKVIEWCIDAGNGNTDFEIIFRPRPETSEDKIRDIFLKLNNKVPSYVHIIKEKTVREWICASDVVVSSYSTSLIEAAVAKKPIYMLKPYEFPDYLWANWYEFVEKIASSSDFTNAIRKENNENDNYKELNNWAISNMMENEDAIESICVYCARQANLGFLRKDQIHEINHRYLYSHRLYNLKAYLVKFIKGNKILTGEGYDVNDRFDDGIVALRVDRWKTVLFKTDYSS